MSKCLVCGGGIHGILIPALRRGFTVVVLLTACEGISFEREEDEQTYQERVQATEVTEEVLMSDGWEKGYVASDCLGGV